jgi:hypothetical protein
MCYGLVQSIEQQNFSPINVDRPLLISQVMKPGIIGSGVEVTVGDRKDDLDRAGVDERDLV